MKRLTHSGNLIMIGFGIAILLMSLLVYKTTQQNFDLVTDEGYYEKEVFFQDEINASQNALPFDSLFAINTAENTVVLTIPPQLSNQVDTGSIHFYCPSNKENDRQIEIQKTTNGLYEINTAGWAKTGYIAKVNFNAGGKRYYKEMAFNLNN